MSAAAVAVALAMSTVPESSSASLADDIERANDGSSDQVSEPQSDVDIATADLDDITEQLQALNAAVAKGEATKKKLAAERKVLNEQASTYQSDIDTIQNRIETLEAELSEQALHSFKEPSERLALGQEDPSDSLRKSGLSRSVVKGKVETAEELRQARAELTAKEASRGEAAEKLAVEVDANTNAEIKYENARNSLVTVAQEAERRAQRTLFEAEGLENVNKVKADELRKSFLALEKQLEIARKNGAESTQDEQSSQVDPRTNSGETFAYDGNYPTEADIVDVGKGIKVHKDIADALSRMMEAAQADGVVLQGWGFRSHARQIELRRANCGSSDYDIYEKPSGSCSPPTARPGNSMHEYGRAIDFTNSAGGTIVRNGPEFRWLVANAATYGFYNLPSEEWHWSINGN